MTLIWGATVDWTHVGSVNDQARGGTNFQSVRVIRGRGHGVRDGDGDRLATRRFIGDAREHSVRTEADTSRERETVDQRRDDPRVGWHTARSLHLEAVG